MVDWYVISYRRDQTAGRFVVPPIDHCWLMVRIGMPYRIDAFGPEWMGAGRLADLKGDPRIYQSDAELDRVLADLRQSNDEPNH